MNILTTAPAPTTAPPTAPHHVAHRVVGSTCAGRVPDVAAEPPAFYDADVPGAGDATTRSNASPRGGVGATGHGVLAELPELDAALAALRTADDAMLTAVTTLAGVLDDDGVATRTGVSVEHWIAITARATRMDRRQVLRTARLLRRFPILDEAAQARELTWTQLRALTLVLRRSPPEFDATADGLLRDLLDHLGGADPDALVRQVEDAVERWRAEVLDRVPESEVPDTPNLSLQPRLDGYGGRVVGDLDAEGLALLDAATAPTPGQRSDPDGVGAVRARNLLARLAGAHGGTCPPEPGEADGVEGANAPSGAPGPNGADGPVDIDALPPVRLLLRMDLDALLGRTSTPATLMTRLIGGRLRLTADAARRLVDERGAELRAMVIDDLGEVVGVGRQHRIPPDWLRDAVLSVHDTCTGPLCDRPGLVADIDHAQPWWPERPDEPFGSTDLDNLGPLCASTNRALRRGGWRATPLGDGRRSWHHAVSGLSITSVPATWRPPHRGSPPTDA